jgi:acrylyl-CoA reductase (NADPH)
MTFRALLVEKDDAGQTRASVQDIDDARLPEGNVTLAVEYSSLNYKDGLCIGPGGGLVRAYPHVPGIDMAGRVEASKDARYKPGDRVVMTGWRVGEVRWGGFATRARVNGAGGSRADRGRRPGSGDRGRGRRGIGGHGASGRPWP